MFRMETVPRMSLEAKVSGSNSVVECQLPKLDVAGSNPVSRSNLFSHLANLTSSGFTSFTSKTRLARRFLFCAPRRRLAAS